MAVIESLIHFASGLNRCFFDVLTAWTLHCWGIQDSSVHSAARRGTRSRNAAYSPSESRPYSDSAWWRAWIVAVLAMLTFCEHTMAEVCADLRTEAVEFNGEADYVHLLVSYPPTLAISTLACADISGRRPTSPSVAAAHHCRSSSNTSTGKTGHPERRAMPADKRDGLAPD